MFLFCLWILLNFQWQASSRCFFIFSQNAPTFFLETEKNTKQNSMRSVLCLVIYQWILMCMLVFAGWCRKIFHLSIEISEFHWLNHVLYARACVFGFQWRASTNRWNCFYRSHRKFNAFIRYTSMRQRFNSFLKRKRKKAAPKIKKEKR